MAGRCGGSLLVLGSLRGLAGAEPVAGGWTPPDELVTAQHLSELITSNQRYAIGAGLAALAALLAVAYLVPLVRAPRWQIFGFAVVPILIAVATMVGLSRPIEPELQRLTHEELENVVTSEVAETHDKALASKVLKWQGELATRGFLIDVSSLPMTATLGAWAAVMAAAWLLSHRTALRAS